MKSLFRDLVPGLIGAVIGGVIGYALFAWIVNQGFYALIVPGAMVGMGSSLLSDTTSKTRGVITGIIGLALGFYSEWAQFPFSADTSFTYFITHLTQLRSLTWIMILVGAGVAWKWGGEAMRPAALSGDRA